MSTRSQLLASMAALALGACSSTVISSTDAGSDAAADLPRTDVVADAPPPPSPCPVAQPAAGSACTRESLECEYGSDPRRECRTVARCALSLWRIQAPGSDGTPRPWCASVPAAMCPATIEAARNQACPAQGAVCSFGRLQCLCTNCYAFPVSVCRLDPIWQCDDRPAEAQCPSAAPRFGEVCAREGLECAYGCNSPNGYVACRGGVWQRGTFMNCPISTRRVKRDVVYLSPAETDAIARQLRATRLATYEYTVPTMAGRRRLGFILEDQPQSFASDPEHSQVDLYGFAAMLAATVQSQDRQIQALTRQVEELQRRTRRR